MKLLLATDHAGFEAKEALKVWLQENTDLLVEDLGAHTLDLEDDYPDYVMAAARKVHDDPSAAKAIIFGGSGQGEAMAANRFPHVRATVYYGGPEEIITLSREHNDANVLSLGVRFISTDEMIAVVQLWLSLPGVSDERHIRRIKKISKI